MRKFLIFPCIIFQLVYHSNGCSYPVDVSFLVADVKYSQERGVQICEIQHGTDSIFTGEAFSNQGISLIAQNFVDFFAAYHQSSWFFPSGITDKKLKDSLEHNFWKHAGSLNQLQRDRELYSKSMQMISDSDSLESYQGFVLARSDIIEQLIPREFSKSLILIDRGMLPVWRDKYRVSLCLRGDPLLESCKPKWELYPKKYHPSLANQIIRDFGGCSCFVIKPRDKFCGNGVIIVEKNRLDQTLKYIFNKTKGLKNDPDRAYRSWYKDDSRTFLVEEYVPSDSIRIPHLGMKPYCPTLRIVFLATYEQDKADIHFLGGYLCLPEKSLSEVGSLHQKYKASLQTIHSAQMDPGMYATVIETLYDPLLLFYRNVLEKKF